MCIRLALSSSIENTLPTRRRSIPAMTSHVPARCLLQPHWDLQEEAIHPDKNALSVDVVPRSRLDSTCYAEIARGLPANRKLSRNGLWEVMTRISGGLSLR